MPWLLLNVTSESSMFRRDEPPTCTPAGSPAKTQCVTDAVDVPPRLRPIVPFWLTSERLTSTLTLPAPDGTAAMPSETLLRTTQLSMKIRVNPVVFSSEMPRLKPNVCTPSMWRAFGAKPELVTRRMPFRPPVDWPEVAPLIERLRMVTTSFDDPTLIWIPLTPEARIDANVPLPSMVRALVIVTPPNPPGSSTSISPPAAVFEMAPANVLQGAVRLHGFTSSPTPETHVRVA